MEVHTPNWKELKLEKQCGVCSYYKQRIVKGKLTARGNCMLKNGVYKQRTDSCLKFKPLSGGKSQ